MRPQRVRRPARRLRVPPTRGDPALPGRGAVLAESADAPDELGQDQPVLASCYGASVSDRQQESAWVDEDGHQAARSQSWQRGGPRSYTRAARARAVATGVRRRGDGTRSRDHAHAYASAPPLRGCCNRSTSPLDRHSNSLSQGRDGDLRALAQRRPIERDFAHARASLGLCPRPAQQHTLDHASAYCSSSDPTNPH